MEKERRDPVAQESRTMPQQRRDNAAECGRNADVCNSGRHSRSDERVTSRPLPTKAKDTPRGAEGQRRKPSEDGRSSDQQEQPQGLLRAQASLPQSARSNPKSLEISRTRLVHENKTTVAKYRATGLVVAESGKNIRVTRRRQHSATANTARETGNADTGIPGQRILHSKRVVEVSYRPGQLVYRKQMVQGRKLEPKWLVPYQVIKRVSNLIYRIRVGPRETNVNIEQLRLCRASREELRDQRIERKRQKRERYSPLDHREEPGERDDVTSTSESDAILAEI
jgi:hypothetical protein